MASVLAAVAIQCVAVLRRHVRLWFAQLAPCAGTEGRILQKNTMQCKAPVAPPAGSGAVRKSEAQGGGAVQNSKGCSKAPKIGAGTEGSGAVGHGEGQTARLQQLFERLDVDSRGALESNALVALLKVFLLDVRVSERERVEERKQRATREQHPSLTVEWGEATTAVEGLKRSPKLLILVPSTNMLLRRVCCSESRLCVCVCVLRTCC